METTIMGLYRVQGLGFKLAPPSKALMCGFSPGLYGLKTRRRGVVLVELMRISLCKWAVLSESGAFCWDARLFGLLPL